MTLFLIFILRSHLTLATLTHGDTSQGPTSYQIDSKIIDGFAYYKLEDFAKALNLKVTYESLTQRVIIKYDTATIIIIPNNPWILLDQTTVNLPIPPTVKDNIVWTPAPLLNEIAMHLFWLKLHKEGDNLFLREARRTIKKIVLDPGHGGKDPGAVGHTRLYEKDVTLKIAKLTKELLEQELGIQCILTREDDTFIPLGRRARMANQAKADMFISIHCNAAKSHTEHGTEVYFLSPAKTNWARAVEARENASLEYETPEERGEVETILWDLAQTEFLKESNFLAGKLVAGICANAKTQNHGVKQANFWVLRGAFMPACLLEVEFISNPQAEKNLRSQEFMKKIAKGIAQGVKEVKERYEKQTF